MNRRERCPQRGTAATETERGSVTSVTRSMFAAEQAIGRAVTCCACGAAAAQRAALRKIRAKMTDFLLFEFSAPWRYGDTT